MTDTSLAQIGYENYYQMLSDKVRMDAYRKAIFDSVKPGDIVVDMGAGTGLLSIWAIQAGAKKVYAIEKTSAIELAKEIAKANNCQHKITFINENSINVELPERADVLISETLGSFGVDENTIRFTNDARERFLVDGGVMIPQSIALFVAPVDNAEVYKKIDFWRHIPDINFLPAFDVFYKKIMIENVDESDFLCQPTCIAEIDLTKNADENFNANLYMNIERQGTVHGVAGWFSCVLCDGVEFTTSPAALQTHWKQAFFPFKEEISVIKGDVLNWTVSVGEKEINSDDTYISYEYRCTQLKNEKQYTHQMKPNQLKPGRNDPCPCGSLKKYKKCCMS